MPLCTLQQNSNRCKTVSYKLICHDKVVAGQTHELRACRGLLEVALKRYTPISNECTISLCISRFTHTKQYVVGHKGSSSSCDTPEAGLLRNASSEQPKFAAVPAAGTQSLLVDPQFSHSLSNRLFYCVEIEDVGILLRCRLQLTQPAASNMSCLADVGLKTSLHNSDHDTAGHLPACLHPAI